MTFNLEIIHAVAMVQRHDTWKLTTDFPSQGGWEIPASRMDRVIGNPGAPQSSIHPLDASQEGRKGTD